MKRCSKCGEVKPATTEYFNRLKGGLQSWCKECKRADHLRNKEHRNQQAMDRYYRLHPKAELPEGFKRCCRCGVIKPSTLEHFGLLRKTKDGFKHQCRECVKAYYESNKHDILRRNKGRYEANKEKVLEGCRLYRLRNAEQRDNYNKRYYAENSDRIKARVTEYHYARIRRDAGYKLLVRYRTRLYQALRGRAKPVATRVLIGCSIEDLMKHLESQFAEGMSWDNYGEWHVDHIKPCATFNFTDKEQARECFHYSNLQPLWADENQRKSAKY